MSYKEEQMSNEASETKGSRVEEGKAVHTGRKAVLQDSKLCTSRHPACTAVCGARACAHNWPYVEARAYAAWFSRLKIFPQHC